MSALKPAQKRQNVTGETQSTLVRTAHTEDLLNSVPVPPTAEGNAHLSSSFPLANKAPAHPKGHRVRELAEVWKTMDAQNFLHLTDTVALNDVWCQPIGVEPAGGAFANVSWRQIVDAPHFKWRIATSKMSTDDLMKMLYLCECIQWNMNATTPLSFEEWVNEKSAACVKVKGLDEGSNRAKLCNFIITEDRDFTFYPDLMKNRFGIFFRKICYHSYKCDDKGSKLVNPSMIKCCATRGKFEYVLEARIIQLPDGWFDIDTAPDTQVLV